MSEDEEYFRTIMCLQTGTSDHPVAEKLMKGEVIRSFDNSPRFAGRILSTTQRVMIRNEVGLIYPHFSFQVEPERIERVLRKITKGLVYTYNRVRLPDNYEVHTRPRISMNDFHQFRRDFGKGCHVGPFWVGNDKVVAFMGARDPLDPATTFWLLLFYNCHAALTFTLPAGTAEQRLASPTWPTC